MNLSNYYWYFSGVLTPKFCDDVIAYANSKEELIARTGGYNDKKLNKDQIKNMQIKTKYKHNQYYDWHCDAWNKPYEKEGPDKGKIRKLSMTCQLTDGSEYTGGELEFDFRNYDPHMRDETKHLRKVFPSFVWHRVKPVTSGTRYSLVVWNVGQPYK